MQITQHIDARMNQRAIRRDLVDLALDLGELDGDRFVLTQKIIDREVTDLQRRLRLLSDARKKGGVVVVADGESLITTYRKCDFTVKQPKNS